MITILTPLADGEYLDPWCDLSIAGQREKCIRIPITRPRNLNSRRISEAECRNELIKYGSSPYTFFMDSDVYFTSPYDVSDCIEYLDKNKDVDAVALDTKWVDIEKQSTKFVVIACFCVRYEKLKNVIFRRTIENEKERCLCIALNKDINIKYLDNRKLGELKR